MQASKILYYLPWAILLVFTLYGCHTVSKGELAGLWQLEHVQVDGYDRTVPPVFIEIKPDNSFALSKTSGDRIGFYRLSDDQLKFRSEEGHWFDTTWDMKYLKERMELKGVEEGFRVTKLSFKRIEKVPDFQEFENRIVGKWQLYKIRTKKGIEKVFDTWLDIDSTGWYSISNKHELLEQGRAIINTRHQKIYFENGAIQWTAWFYGDELRFDNERLGIQYSLRKAE